MAGENRTEKATPKKIRQARQEGNVPQSTLLPTVLLLIGSVFILGIQIPKLSEKILLFARDCWSTPLAESFPVSFFSQFERLRDLFLSPLMTLALLAILIPFLCYFLMRGWLFLPNRLFPKFSRIVGLSGLKALFSSDSLWRGTDAFLKTLLAFLLLYLAFRGFSLTIPETAPSIGPFLLTSLLGIGKRIGIVLLGLAIGDFVYRRWKWSHDLMMTPEEIRQEQRESEGKPEVKAVRNDLMKERQKKR